MHSGFLPSEGAGAVLLGKPPATMTDDTRQLPLVTSWRDGEGYRSRSEAQNAASELFGQLSAANSESSSVWFGSAQHNWLADTETGCVPVSKRISSPHPYLGEAFTASALWQLIRACSSLSECDALAVPFFGHNSQISACQLSLYRSY
jgi:hypothetical protein